MSASTATLSAYCCKGLELTLLAPEVVRAWADAEISRATTPAYPFIEISLAKTTAELISALHTIEGDADDSLAGRWLLSRVALLELTGVGDLATAIRKAMNVCRHCGLPDSLYYEFDGLDDALYLARSGQYGSVERCRTDFLELLNEHAVPAPRLSEA